MAGLRKIYNRQGFFVDEMHKRAIKLISYDPVNPSYLGPSMYDENYEILTIYEEEMEDIEKTKNKILEFERRV